MGNIIHNLLRKESKRVKHQWSKLSNTIKTMCVEGPELRIIINYLCHYKGAIHIKGPVLRGMNGAYCLVAGQTRGTNLISTPIPNGSGRLT